MQGPLGPAAHWPHSSSTWPGPAAWVISGGRIRGPLGCPYSGARNRVGNPGWTDGKDASFPVSGPLYARAAGVS